MNGPEWGSALRTGIRDMHYLAVLVTPAHGLKDFLFHGLVVCHQDVTNGVAANDVTDFFREVLGVIAGAFE
jgi:hypothetical protein